MCVEQGRYFHITNKQAVLLHQLGILCWITSVVSDSVPPHRWQPTRLPRPWDSPGKNTGVGCHFLLQCMKVKSESEVNQFCPTLSDPMDCSLPGSSIHGIFQARVLQWGAIAFSRISSSLTWFWHYLEIEWDSTGWGLSLSRLPSSSDATYNTRLSPVLLIDQLQIGGSHCPHCPGFN